MGHEKCNTSGCHAHHHHSCGCQSCGCQQEKCSCSCHQHQDFAKDLLTLADEAWMEVLKDKIKKEIEKNNGSHLDELAKLVANSNNDRWKNKMATKSSVDNFEEKMAEFFHHK